MSKGVLFWALMLIWLIFGFIVFWPSGIGGAWLYAPLGSHVLLFVLFAILGWHNFGPPVKG